MKFKNKALRIACDGESASGKSLASKLIGRKYGLYVLNSGIAYRYASFLIIKYKPKKIVHFLKKKFRNLNYKKINHLNLHSQKISNHVVNLAKQKKVRFIIRMFQKKIIKKHSRIVVEGRDTASSILRKNPPYTVAFYFSCSLAVSSFRRWRDLSKRIPLKEIKKSLKNRTLQDKIRRQNPLIKVPDAVEIRTHLLTKSQMVQKMSKEIDKKLLLKYGSNFKARKK
jgi:cytidylate kinase